MLRRLPALILLVLLFSSLSTHAQQTIFRDTTPHQSVRYLPDAPKIDGRLDMEVADLPVHQFGVIEKTDSTAPTDEVTYRMAYSGDFLYLYIEAPAKQITYRDRGYQNGDGFIVVISSVDPKMKPTREFYVLGFTPQKDTNQAWQKSFVWYHDVDLIMSPLKRTQFAQAELGDKVAYEVLIPWNDLYPYHPWLGTEIGFNLCYVTAVGGMDKTYHMVVPDDQIQSEQHPRAYTPLTFLPPNGSTPKCAVKLDRNHLTEGGTINAKVAFIADSGVSQLFDLFISAGVKSGQGQHELTFVGTGNLDTLTVRLSTRMLLPGDFKVWWVSGTDSGDFGFTVLPSFDSVQSGKDLAAAMGLSKGSRTSLQFLLAQIEAAFASLKPYSTAAELRKNINEFQALLADAKGLDDKFASRTGIFRRAFQSALDGTLQPYSVKIPANFDRKKKYPLFVYLHGSGDDDQNQLTSPMIPDSLICLAPFARGTSNVYSADHAQEDIIEAINDVMANYPIDSSRVIISGFSMGGYGAYRAYYEHPGRYKAIAVFSGHPNLSNQWSGRSTEPNFLNQKYLTPFAGKDLFIFHGGQDRNCGIELTQELVKNLKTAGANVDFVYEPDAGHQMPSKESIRKFQDWLSAETK